jgi:RNA polymerase sigma-70 factor (ECF subfamily)
MEHSDIELIDAYRSGENVAIETLIERYFRSIYSFVFRMIRSESDASDIVQDIFVKVWKYIGRFDATKEFKPWLFTIAHNTVIDWTRKKKPLLFSSMTADDAQPFEETLADIAPLPDAVFINNEWKKMLDDAIETLPLAQREVILLHHQDDLTFESIATLLKKPANTVKSSYRRGMMKLREAFIHAPN